MFCLGIFFLKEGRIGGRWILGEGSFLGLLVFSGRGEVDNLSTCLGFSSIYGRTHDLLR